MNCNAKPLRYWRRWNRVCEAVDAGILPTLPALCIVNTCGNYVAGPHRRLRYKPVHRCRNNTLNRTLQSCISRHPVLSTE